MWACATACSSSTTRPSRASAASRPSSTRSWPRSCATSSAGAAAATKTGRKRAITRAIKEVAHYLGNTPAVARASYIDPRVFDRYRDGEAVDHRLIAAAAGDNGDATAIQGPVEKAVLELLAD